MAKFLIEAECADDTLGHQLFWCCKCDTNKVDSLEHTTGRFFTVSGHEFAGTIGECKKIVFAVCTGCLSTNMWVPEPPKLTVPIKQKPTIKIKQVLTKSPLTWNQVQKNPIFKHNLSNKDLEACVGVTVDLMECSPEVARELVSSI